ncbi:ATP-binding mismatch repair protein Ecym_5379 [Eremothecium cymbalariae DBVPG|uniref:DNA mismatch repair protein PMS1 n=1 Tax=Eremothecium cymbalariae (strain CBS 270.75 / DBVPG 7215 / KCTC 17166 / NRRL Y-17582) TaxID=931890 RepID=I6NDJ2_ERECY|nr:hypothetical protein Ecym_5379 [Eremothecium cymbalariae DBVPG\
MSGQITAITIKDVHKITSGQVIIDLTTAVKELVENSLDAHADKIDLTFKNYGLESIECSDNGDGISEANFEYLALKHHTSKIQEFEDISKVDTFGFRGEALASLCAMANLTVFTTKRGPKAHKLDYDPNGKLVKTSIISRNKGTTVQLQKLFNNFPVRKKDFVKNCKRQFSKCVTLLQSYVLINPQCKISVWHVTANKNKSLVLSTPLKSDVSRNILMVFGSDGLRGLQSLTLTLDLNQYKEQMGKKYLGDPSWDVYDYTISVSGYISKPSYGCGRAGKDRQFIYINGRPVNYQQIVKCCNDTYRTFNMLEYPVLILNFKLLPQLVDVNVTPDKRTVMLHNEEFVLQCLEERLEQYFKDQQLSLPKSEPQTTYRAAAADNTADNTVDDADLEFVPKRAKTLPSQELTATFENDGSSQDQEDMGSKEGITKDKIDSKEAKISDSTSFKPEFAQHSATMEKAVAPAKKQSDLGSFVHVSQEFTTSMNKAYEETRSPSKEPVVIHIGSTKIEEFVTNNNNKLIFSPSPSDKEQEEAFERANNSESKEYISNDHSDVEDVIKSDPHCCSHSDSSSIEQSFPTSQSDPSQHIQDVKPVLQPSNRNNYDGNLATSSHNLETSLDTSLDLLRKELKCSLSLLQTSIHTRSFTRNKEFEDSFNSEQFLTLTVSKDDFNKMSIVGQFNLGFIIVTRRTQNKHDLFIVDQHASDEKFNFETLQKTTIFKSQNLIKPQRIEMNVIDELLVLDNLELFRRNGFKINSNENNPPGSRIEVVSLPSSKQMVFKMDDFYELLHLLKECNGINKSRIRCSKIRSMFAMRACRMSIMIGRPLNRRTMTKVIRNLNELEKPWNCPHGRPTIRHLMELKDWESFQKDYEL